jgi:hypothetical protein
MALHEGISNNFSNKGIINSKVDQLRERNPNIPDPMEEVHFETPSVDGGRVQANTTIDCKNCTKTK